MFLPAIVINLLETEDCIAAILANRFKTSPQAISSPLLVSRTAEARIDSDSDLIFPY
jgi:hypothetical protein